MKDRPLWHDLVIGGGIAAGGTALGTSPYWYKGAGRLAWSGVKAGARSSGRVGKWAATSSIKGIWNTVKSKDFWSIYDTSRVMSTAGPTPRLFSLAPYRLAKGIAGEVSSSTKYLARNPIGALALGLGSIAVAGVGMVGIPEDTDGIPKQPTNINASTYYAPNMTEEGPMSHSPHQMLTSRSRKQRYDSLANSTMGLVQGLHNGR